MRIVIVGSGAIGTWLGAALQATGQDVVLVARGAHLEALQRAGATLHHHDGTAQQVAIAAVADARQAEDADLAILAVKAHDLPAVAPAIAELAPTTLLTAHNGVPWWWSPELKAPDPRGVLAGHLPASLALGSVVYLGASISAPGEVRTRPEAGLVLGEPDGSDSPRLREIAGALEQAGFPVRVTDDIRREILTKLMGNATLNLASVATRAGLGTMTNDPGVGPLIERGMHEIAELGAAMGHRPDVSVAERIEITRRLGDHKPSTLQDLEAGKPLELDALGAAVIELADLHGVSLPTIRTLYALADLQARQLGLRPG